MDQRNLILWRRLDLPGHEIAELTSDGDGWQLLGVVLVAHDGRPCRLDYLIDCDAMWTTRAVQIHGHINGAPADLELSRMSDGTWYANGTIVPALQHCIDVDLGFSPATNLLPIRRLGLAVGDRAAVRAAWVRFPQLTVEVLEQEYARTGPVTYHYESAGGVFRRELSVNSDGFVIEYPGLWRAEAVTGEPGVRAFDN
ncbi:MAG: putative glycolipid-binding domain-containing protein [bacterium]